MCLKYEESSPNQDVEGTHWIGSHFTSMQGGQYRKEKWPLPKEASSGRYLWDCPKLKTTTLNSKPIALWKLLTKYQIITASGKFRDSSLMQGGQYGAAKQQRAHEQVQAQIIWWQK